VTNYMIADGLLAGGQAALARRIVDKSLETIERAGFAEYYDPIDATPCGGGHFSWTAAMALELIAIQQAAASGR
jgi:glycogen debranching enzyme